MYIYTYPIKVRGCYLLLEQEREDQLKTNLICIVAPFQKGLAPVFNALF